MRRRISSGWVRVTGGGDSGTVTAEYAIVIMVAVGFASVLLGIMHGAAVSALLQGVVKRALTIPV